MDIIKRLKTKIQFKKNKKPRIFIGFFEIAGYYKNLCEGFQKIGVESYHVSYGKHKFAYENKQKEIFLVTLINFFIDKLQSSDTSKFKSRICSLGLIICELFLLIWAIGKFDTFIFSFGSSFFSATPYFKQKQLLYKELPFLKKLGKKIIYVFHGSDERPPYLDGNFQDIEAPELAKMTKQWRDKMKCIEKYADEIISHPPSSQFHECKMIQWLQIGIPFKFIPQEKPSLTAKLTILHCPSNLAVKGTLIIRQVIEELQGEGYCFDYVEISGKPNNEVINAIQQADIIIDQLYSDTPMAGLATEAAAYAKPSIVTGYELDKVISFLETSAIPPSLCGKPEDLKKLLLCLINDADFRHSLGQRAYHFIESNWEASKVAERFLTIINNSTPPSWYFDPTQCHFSHGVGIERQSRKKVLAKLYHYGGEEAFHLSDKPQILDDLISVANAGNNYKEKLTDSMGLI